MNKLLIAASLVGGSAIAGATPPLPPALEPYVHDGQYDPGNYGWMRGSFPGASAGDKAAFQSVMTWREKCEAEGRSTVLAELRAMGVQQVAMPQLLPIRDPLCSSVGFRPFPPRKTYSQLQKDANEARPYADGYLFALRNLRRMPRSGSFSDQLRSRVIPDQLVRIFWGEGQWSDAPRLSPGAKAVMNARIGAAMVVVDHENTEWLKGMLDRHQWPTISRDGEDAATNAWLLVQHADADPAFQLRVLKLMEPLASKGEVKKQDYALLYDRVTLKITGKQRYGTQMTCSEGKLVPQPVEDEAELESRRASMSLPPMADYMKIMMEHSGGCPSGV